MRKFYNLLLLFGLGLGVSQAQTISSFPYTQDFEGESQGSTSCAGAYVMAAPGWFNDTTDDMDWSADVNGTGSSPTGPTANGGADHNPGVAGGFYLYIESSSPCNNGTNVASLESPYFDFTALPAPQLKFWYHMFGADMGTMHVDARVGSTGVWDLDLVLPWTDDQDLWQEQVVSLFPYAGLDSVQFRVRCIVGAGFLSDFAIDDFSVFNVFPDDAALLSVDNPVSPISIGANDIAVTIQNAGGDTLFTADVQWEIDGILQPVFNYVGALANLETDPAVVIGNYIFPAGLTNLKVWIENPNGNVDPANANDTLTATFCTSLNGVYTLGGAGADFASFTDLGGILSSCGLGSDVTININPGTYTDRLILDHVPGLSPTSTLTIDGGSTGAVTLSNNSFSNIYLNGTSYTTIKNMTLENTGTTDAYGVQMRDNADYNVIQDCIINMSMATGLSDVIGVSASDLETSSFTEGQNANWTTVSNCQINGGEKGIHFEGESTLRNIGNVFMNNTIDSAEDYGFYMDDQDSIMIVGNTIKNLTNAQADGIYTFDLQMFTISYNNVTAPDYGLYIADGNYNLDGVPTSRGAIINNMIGSGSDYGMYLDQIEQTDIWFNSVYNIGTTSSGAFRINDMIDVTIYNNVFASEGSYAFQSLDDINIGLNKVNYNCYFTPVSNIDFVTDGGVTFNDLATWQVTVPSANLNSIETDPVFMNAPDDLHALSTIMNDMGDNALGILDDIDGDVRPAGINVDMGADEYSPFLANAEAIGFSEPASIICGDSLTPITVIIGNLGDTIFSVDIDVNVTGSITQSFNVVYTDTLLFGQTAAITVGTINTYGGGSYMLAGVVTLAGDQDPSNDSISGAFDARPFEPSGTDVFVCDTNQTYLYANAIAGVTHAWYANLTDTVAVGNADSLLVPDITAQGTYYLQYSTSADSLLAGDAAGNGCGGGNMFDITAINTINLTGFSVSSGTALGGSFDVTVHYIANASHIGSETNAAAWTTVGTFNQVSAGDGAGIFTFVDMAGSTILIPAGSTYAIYIEYDANYTTGAIQVMNNDMVVDMGTGLCSSFGGTNNPRSFNGKIFYGSEACSDIRVPVTASNSFSGVAAFTATSTGLDVVFDASAAVGDSLMFDFGDGATSSTTVASHTYATAGNYTVCLTTYSVCGDSTSCQVVIVCGPMAAAFTSTVSNLTLTFTDATTGGPVTWHWDFGDTNTSNQQNPVHTYAAGGTYTVTLTTTDACGVSSTTTTTIVIVGTNDLDISSLIQISPNPSEGLIQLMLNSWTKDDVSIMVMDQVGKVVYSEKISNTGNDQERILDLQYLPQGMYFLRMISGDQTGMKKIIIQK